MIKKINLVTLFTFLLVCEMQASVKVGELYYNLNNATKEAVVTFKSQVGDDYNGGWNIKHVTIPSSVTYNGSVYEVVEIGEHAFCDCKSLISIEFQHGVGSIGMMAFYGCEKLYSISLPTSMTSIGVGAFYGCKNLTYATIPYSVKSIGKFAFYDCIKLTSIDIPDGVTRIGSSTFKNCEKLYSVTIPSSVQYIDGFAFNNCRSLKSVYIPDRIRKIEGYAFSNCESLKEFYCPTGLNHTSIGLTTSTKVITRSTSKPNKKGQKVVQPTLPPLLVLEEESLAFTDANGNNRIDADEACNITFTIENKGQGPARNCEVRVRLSGTTQGVTTKTVRLPIIDAGRFYEVSVPIVSDINTKDGNIIFKIEVYEPGGWGIAPFEMTVDTKVYEQPLLRVVDYNISSASGKIRKMEPFTLTFNVQNTKYGEAKDVRVNVNIPSDLYVMDGSVKHNYSRVKSGEAKSIQITLIANNNFSFSNIPITIEIEEKYGKFAENKHLDIALNQSAISNINIAAKDEPKQSREEIKLALLKSDVDRNIPTTKARNDNAFVLIIANEHYSQVASVPFALNDGNIFREYCVKTLGIGEKHIKYLTDATGNQIKAGVNWLSNLTEAFENPQIIVYYAGHGIPDESNKSAYLLPVDGSGTDISTGYKLDDLYATLGQMPASRIAVFMDACFSGSKREDGMLVSARGVALKAKSGVPQGNMVVFSAAQGDETAYPNREQQHGLFTYYLLKKLQETEGDVELKELGDYVTKQVTQQSLLLNSKKQTPCVTPSASVETEWQSWKLK